MPLLRHLGLWTKGVMDSVKVIALRIACKTRSLLPVACSCKPVVDFVLIDSILVKSTEPGLQDLCSAELSEGRAHSSMLNSKIVSKFSKSFCFLFAKAKDEFDLDDAHFWWLMFEICDLQIYALNRSWLCEMLMINECVFGVKNLWNRNISLA